MMRGCGFLVKSLGTEGLGDGVSFCVLGMCLVLVGMCFLRVGLLELEKGVDLVLGG